MKCLNLYNRKGNYAEQMFESMTTKDGSTYEAMVLGLIKVLTTCFFNQNNQSSLSRSAVASWLMPFPLDRAVQVLAGNVSLGKSSPPRCINECRENLMLDNPAID